MRNPLCHTMADTHHLDQIAERVERLLLRHEELQRTNALLVEQVAELAGADRADLDAGRELPAAHAVQAEGARGTLYMCAIRIPFAQAIKVG